jgi:hypothetical protein
MKNLIHVSGLLVLLLFTQTVSAIPVVNENVANSGIITIYPDHVDANRFYIAPNVVTLAQDAAGLPVIAYNEFTSSSGTKKALLQMNLTAAYTRVELEAAKTGILAKNPAAQFSGLPFISSELKFDIPIEELISKHSCNHPAGLVGQEQSCTILLTRRGREFFRKAVATKSVFVTLSFEYIVKAVVKNAANQFENIDMKHGIAARLGGDQLAAVPGLLK